MVIWLEDDHVMDSVNLRSHVVAIGQFRVNTAISNQMERDNKFTMEWVVEDLDLQDYSCSKKKDWILLFIQKYQIKSSSFSILSEYTYFSFAF